MGGRGSVLGWRRNPLRPIHQGRAGRSGRGGGARTPRVALQRPATSVAGWWLSSTRTVVAARARLMSRIRMRAGGCGRAGSGAPAGAGAGGAGGPAGVCVADAPRPTHRRQRYSLGRPTPGALLILPPHLGVGLGRASATPADWVCERELTREARRPDTRFSTALMGWWCSTARVAGRVDSRTKAARGSGSCVSAWRAMAAAYFAPDRVRQQRSNRPGRRRGRCRSSRYPNQEESRH